MQSQPKKLLKLNNPKIAISKQKKATVTLKPFIPLQSKLTKKMIAEYGADFENSINSNNGLNPPLNSLKYHDISKELRARMVNWMIEVTNIFETQHHTFFTAVTIMDLFYANSTKILNSEDIHLTGMVSMFIASKYVDYCHLSMRRLITDIGHNSFTVKQIKDKEREIMKTLGFNIIFATTLTFLDNFIQKLLFGNSQLNTKQINTLNRIKRLSIYFGKMSLYEYDMLKYR
jgi:cyclin B